VAKIKQVEFYSPLCHGSQSDLFEQNESGNLPAVFLVPCLVEDHLAVFHQLTSKIDWATRFASRNSTGFGVSYHNKGRQSRIRSMPAFLQPISKLIELSFGFMPNNCVANEYPGGNNYISFHSDQDMEMNDHTGVVIISFGETREMVLRKIDAPQIRYHYPLPPGSGFYMSDELQKSWEHGIPRQTGAGRRISLSFRSLRT